MAYPCAICEKDYSTKYYLRTHIATEHEGKSLKIFQCNFCEKSFQGRYQLKKHQSIAHFGEVKQRIKCSVCEKVMTKKALKAHVKYAHREVHETKCDRCEKTFLNEERLIHHKAGECNGSLKLENMFKCELCQSHFISEQTLDRHMENVHRWTCNLCNYSFGNEDVLKITCS